MDIKYFTDLIEFFMQCNICLRVNTDLKKVGGDQNVRLWGEINKGSSNFIFVNICKFVDTFHRLSSAALVVSVLLAFMKKQQKNVSEGLEQDQRHTSSYNHLIPEFHELLPAKFE